ncbi:hypothetical protein [Colwellia maritima]|uniref:hypothetical protein n=1 Tax=Colwellia maritima TaxID=2912588 RepID=UPI003B8469BD
MYGGGACESLFGELLKASPSLRDKIIITSKVVSVLVMCPILAILNAMTFLITI